MKLLIGMLMLMMLCSLHARQKSPVTSQKVSGSVLDLVKKSELAEKERDALASENERLKQKMIRPESSQWFVVNGSSMPLKLISEIETLCTVPAHQHYEGVVKSVELIEANKRLQIQLGKGAITSVAFKPGVESVVEGSNGRLCRVYLDFLLGRNAWLIVVQPNPAS